MIFRNKIGGQNKKPKSMKTTALMWLDRRGFIPKVTHGFRESTKCGQNVTLVGVQRAPVQKEQLSHPRQNGDQSTNHNFRYLTTRFATTTMIYRSTFGEINLMSANAVDAIVGNAGRREFGGIRAVEVIPLQPKDRKQVIKRANRRFQDLKYGEKSTDEKRNTRLHRGDKKIQVRRGERIVRIRRQDPKQEIRKRWP